MNLRFVTKAGNLHTQLEILFSQAHLFRSDLVFFVLLKLDERLLIRIKKMTDHQTFNKLCVCAFTEAFQCKPETLIVRLLSRINVIVEQVFKKKLSRWLGTVLTISFSFQKFSILDSDQYSNSVVFLLTGWAK